MVDPFNSVADRDRTQIGYMKSMSSKLKYHSWYFRNWSDDLFVKGLTLEVKGAYFELLNTQMCEGSIPADFEKQLDVFGRHAPTLERYKKEIWPIISGKWVPVEEIWDDEKKEMVKLAEPDSKRLHNRKLTEWMVRDYLVYAGKSLGGKRGAATRAAQKTEEVLQRLANQPTFDFESILKFYPVRLDEAGWDEGIEDMKLEISTEDEYAALEAAIKNYAHVNRSQPKRFILQLNNFMKKWQSFIPRDFTPPSRRATPKATDEPDKPKRRVLAPGDTWPWDRVSSELAAQFWPPEKRERYMAGEKF